MPEACDPLKRTRHARLFRVAELRNLWGDIPALRKQLIVEGYYSPDSGKGDLHFSLVRMIRFIEQIEMRLKNG